MSGPELIACQECGCLNEDATALLAQAEEHMKGLERELRTKRAKITRLESEKRDKLLKSKRYTEAMDVLRHWHKVCAPKAREIDSDERLSAVIARLNGKHTVEELKLCADGYAKVPYVTRNGRSASGQPSEWFADAELIYRTPENVRKGIAYASSALTLARQATPLPSGSIERLPWRRVWDANRRLLVKHLGAGEAHPGGYHLYPCPKCSTDPSEFYLPLRVADEPRAWLAQCQRCGIDEIRLLAAITEDKHELRT